MTFRFTRDLDLVRRVMTHPSLYRHLVDDFCPNAVDFEPLDHPSVQYVEAMEDEETIGIFMLVPHNGICWEVHTCLLPLGWGLSDSIVREGLMWLWKNAPVRRVITTVPDHNRLALRLALAGGMAQYGLNPASFQLHGKLHDLILLGVSRPEES